MSHFVKAILLLLVSSLHPTSRRGSFPSVSLIQFEHSRNSTLSSLDFDRLSAARNTAAFRTRAYLTPSLFFIPPSPSSLSQFLHSNTRKPNSAKRCSSLTELHWANGVPNPRFIGTYILSTHLTLNVFIRFYRLEFISNAVPAYKTIMQIRLIKVKHGIVVSRI